MRFLKKDLVCTFFFNDKKIKLLSDDIKIIQDGLKIPDFGIVRAEISLLEIKDKDHFIWDVVLNEGKKREIKRIFSYFNSSIRKLHRYEFAGIKLGNIKSGKYRRMSYSQFKKVVLLKK